MAEFKLITTNEILFCMAAHEIGEDLASLIHGMDEYASLRIALNGKERSGKTTFARRLAKPTLSNKPPYIPTDNEKYAYSVQETDADGNTHQVIFSDNKGMDYRGLRLPKRKHKGLSIVEHTIAEELFDMTVHIERPDYDDTNIITVNLDMPNFPVGRLLKNLRDKGITAELTV